MDIWSAPLYLNGREIGAAFAIRPMTKGLFMLNVATDSNAASGAAAPAAAAFTAQGPSFNPPGAPTFSQVFAGSKSAQSQPRTAKSLAPTAASQPGSTQANSATPGIAPHSAKDSSSQPGTTPNTTTAQVVAPVTIDNSSAAFSLIQALLNGSLQPSVPLSARQVPASTSASDAAPEVTANISGDGAAEPATPVTASSIMAASSPADTDESIEGTQSGTTPKTGPARISPSPPLATATAQQPASNLAPAQAAPFAKEAAAKNLELLQDSAAAAQGAQHVELPLPNAATLISANGENESPAASAKSATENRESIAQRTQPGLPTVAAPSQADAVQAALATNGNSSDGANSGNGGGQGSAHANQSGAQGSTQTRASDDTKSSSAAESSQPSAQSSDSQLLMNQTNQANLTAAANTAASASAMSTAAAHTVTQSAAQIDTAAGPASPKATVDSSPAASTLAPSLPQGLPRSLSDVSQATQLYQRVGGAEMHIAMDTDLLGAIDLRAVFHQGSLSATIGVQRADVQTLLVNELPALQHSLAEKNLQVAQISVLAGSIGTGANPNSQPNDQQNRQQSASTPNFQAYADEPSVPSGMRAPVNELAALAGNSARLSVLA
jgi:DNA segregation ATPase FtsK/SpoIIIE, S-DNA-T family